MDCQRIKQSSLCQNDRLPSLHSLSLRYCSNSSHPSAKLNIIANCKLIASAPPHVSKSQFQTLHKQVWIFLFPVLQEKKQTIKVWKPKIQPNSQKSGKSKCTRLWWGLLWRCNFKKENKTENERLNSCQLSVPFIPRCTSSTALSTSFPLVTFTHFLRRTLPDASVLFQKKLDCVVVPLPEPPPAVPQLKYTSRNWLCY